MDYKEVSFPCIKVSQPIGEFFIGSMDAKDLIAITEADIRRIERDEERDVETYLGIQRPLSKNRISKLKEYVRTVDACFPTSIIVAVPEKCAFFNKSENRMTLRSHKIESEDEDGEVEVTFEKIAPILDGQHRLKGLEGFEGKFEINVSIFVEADLEQQAQIFSTVNLAQTKVNKSLAYDLYDLATSRSPQRTCHDIAVAFSDDPEGPFYRRIKRLGFAHEESPYQTITQATFVENLMKLISRRPMQDRSDLIKGKKLQRPTEKELKSTPFRDMFISEDDVQIATIVSNYFEAVRNIWPYAWNSSAKGYIIARTNGFKALIRLLPKVYLQWWNIGDVPTVQDFQKKLSSITLKAESFTTDNYPPGQTGEALLLKTLMKELKLQ